MRPLNANVNGSWCPSNTHPHQQQLHHSLKINKESHIIKKPSSTTSSSSSSSLSQGSQGASPPTPPPPPPPHPPKPQQRPPVIIYTHSPKIIHTHPKDFMALVQKLTGMSRTDQEADDPHHGATDNKKIDVSINNGNFMSRNRNHYHDPQGNNRSDPSKVMGSNHEDNESLSGITTNEDMFSNGGSDNGQVNSNCIGTPSMSYHQDHPTNSFMGNMTLPHYTGGSNNSNNNHSNNSYNELLCCGGRSDPTYDFIDFNMPFN